MKNTIYLLVFLFSLTLLSCGGGKNDTGSVSFGLKFEQTSAASEIKQAPSAASAVDICASYGIDSISGTVYNSSNTAIATGGPWACSTHQGTITNIPAGSNLKIEIQGTVASSVVWQGETTGVTVTADHDTDVGTVTMTYIGSDTTPPTISSFTPSDSDINVPVTTTITATFNVGMASSTINTDTFTLFDYGTNSYVSGSVTYDSSTMTATFTPSANLSYDTMYMANMQAGSNGVLDYKGWGIIGTTWVQFTTEDEPTSAPSAPTGVSATAGDSAVEITWTGSTGATSYNIYYSTTSGVTKTTGTEISSVTSPYTHTSLTNGTTYYYVVTAVNSYGESGESSQAFATPVATPITLVSGLNDPLAIAIDSTNVYWTENGTTANSGTVNKVNINGGTVTTLASGQINPGGIALDSTNVYWTDFTSVGTVNKVAINGGTPTTIASEQWHPEGIAVDSTNIYWAESSSGQYVSKASINGGTAITLANENPKGGIAVDSTNVYWTDSAAVKKVSINGGTITTIASELGSPWLIAVDSANVYWTEYDGNNNIGSVNKVSINGGAVTTLASGKYSLFVGLTVDSTSVYFADSGYGTLNKISIDGGAITTLASGVSGLGRIAIDSTYVYWAQNGAIKKIAK